MNTFAWVLQIVLAVLFFLHGLLFTVAYSAAARRVEARGRPPSSLPPARRPRPPVPPPPRFCGDCAREPLAYWTFDDCNTQSAELADYCDLDGNLLTKNDPYQGVTAEKGVLSFAAAPDKFGLRVRARAV